MCLTPFHKKSTGEVFPCSKCPDCIARRISAWSFRLQQEEKQSRSAHFITLTYATENLPFKNGQQTLQKTDIQKFFKRLRKAHGKKHKPIKYYCAGEYGTRTHRPHYHVAIFNARIDLLQPAWALGSIHYGRVEPASIAYTLKYLSKSRQHKKPIGKNPEFQLTSKGLGSNYLTTAMIKWHKSDLKQKMYCTLPDNKKISMPRYYKDKIYTDEERKIISTHFQQQQQIAHEKFVNDPNFNENYQNKIRGIEAAFKTMYKSSLKLQTI